LDIMDMRRIQTVPRRQALLVCMLHQAQVHTRDQLVEMFTRDELGSPALWAGRKSSACRRQAQPWLC
jgi:hypothetical protein